MSEQLAHDLLALTRLFDAGGWKELRVEYPGTSILFSHNRAAVLSADVSAAPRTAQVGAAEPHAAPTPAPTIAASPDTAPVDPAWTAVAAPNIGTFYRSPKPGAAPFVELGQQVAAGSELCLLEVMKLFTSVTAPVAGTVRRIVAQDGELVEGGQMLFYIEAE
ncbi:acetyl-CoA carboxylase biotin carboxyl carrier protein [Novosphingobium lentum]|uniref:acetyl-CoA carboxylase biotin carboxyl carrier protein n=1 Tax=Novosphingobium lentum TaxID=145287 RepID=UPI00082B795B|nr:biotin/lipoyl-containing protein [Novosphingobium lentum]